MASGMAGLGLLSLVYGDFALQWQPVPEAIPLREALARLSGVTLLACAAGLATRRLAVLAAAGLAAILFSWVLLHGPALAAQFQVLGVWLVVAETLTLTCGAWILFAALAERAGGAGGRLARPARSIPAARTLFAVCCLVFGLSHFVYPEITASMIPAWMPDRLFLACLTGACHMAAGLGLLLDVFPRLAATLEAVMMSAFVVLVHATGILGAPSSRLQWTLIFVAVALSGAAWAVAGSLGDAPWGLRRSTMAGTQPA
jgi:uncharacterized membrane protein